MLQKKNHLVFLTGETAVPPAIILLLFIIILAFHFLSKAEQFLSKLNLLSFDTNKHSTEFGTVPIKTSHREKIRMLISRALALLDNKSNIMTNNNNVDANSIYYFHSLIHSGDGLTLETSVFECFDDG